MYSTGTDVLSSLCHACWLSRQALRTACHLGNQVVHTEYVVPDAVFCGTLPAPRHSLLRMPQLCTSCAAWRLATAATSACSGWRCKTSTAGGLQQLAHRGRAKVQLHGSCVSCWHQYMPLRGDASYRRCQLRNLRRAARHCPCPRSSGGLWLCLRNGVLLRQAASGELESTVLETHTALQARHADNHADTCTKLLDYTADSIQPRALDVFLESFLRRRRLVGNGVAFECNGASAQQQSPRGCRLQQCCISLMQVRDPVAADGATALRQRMLQAQALGRADLAAQVTAVVHTSTAVLWQL
jgi:hypothetical protein